MESWLVFLKDYMSPDEDAGTAICEEQDVVVKPRQDSDESSLSKLSPLEDKPDGKKGRARRQAQNRAAQRAFRQRKEQYTKELENAIEGLKNTLAATRLDNLALKQRLLRAQINSQLLSAVLLSSQALSNLSTNDRLTRGKVEIDAAVTDESSEILQLSEVWRMKRIQELFAKDTINIGHLSMKLVDAAVLGRMPVVITKAEVIQIIEELETGKPYDA